MTFTSLKLETATAATLATLLIFASLPCFAQGSAPSPSSSKVVQSSPGGGTGIAKPAHQFSIMVGAALDSGQEPNGGGYQHQTWQSPVGRIAYHYSFMAKRTMQLLLGGQVVVSESVSEASGGSNGRTAKFTTNRIDGAASVGLGFSPGKGPFNIQGFLSVGSNFKNKRMLKSSGFTAEIDNSWSDEAVPLILIVDLNFSYDLTEDVRAIAGLNFITDSTSSLLMGAAFAF